MAKSRVRSLQYAVFQPIFFQTLQAIGKCKRLQERLTVERRLCYPVCISLLLKENCNKCKVYLLTLDIPEGILVSSIIAVYSGFKYKVIILQQQCQHSPFEINKHQYSSININMKVFDTGLNKRVLFFNNQTFNCFINNDF